MELAKFRMIYGLSLSELYKAVDGLTELAETGEVEAQYTLGKLYIYGHKEVIDKDTDKAILWLTKVANRGDFEAKALLGLAYSRKANSVETGKVAEEWFKKAAESGDPIHIKLLARFYINFSKANPEYKGLGEEIMAQLNSKQ